MSDATTVLGQAQQMDSVLGALSSLPFWIDKAIERHTKDRWGDVYFPAMAAWALHRALLAAREAGGAVPVAGPMQSKRTMDVSVSYAATTTIAAGTPWDGDYHLTTWGRIYADYLRTRAAGRIGYIS